MVAYFKLLLQQVEILSLPYILVVIFIADSTSIMPQGGAAANYEPFNYWTYLQFMGLRNPVKKSLKVSLESSSAVGGKHK